MQWGGGEEVIGRILKEKKEEDNKIEGNASN